MSDTMLYLITPPDLDLDTFPAQLEQALSGGHVASVQLRLKDATDEDIIAAAKLIKPLCHRNDVAFILNDRPDLAIKVGADGVHLGQDDMPIKEARALLGDDMVIGVTCHDSKHLSMQAGESGADYVAFGAFFPTSTKDVSHQASPEILTWWVELMELPCVAIGGVTVDNAEILVKAGADFIAVCNGVWQHEKGPKAAVAEFNKIINSK